MIFYMHFKERNPVFAETKYKILKEADDSGSYFKIIVCITNVPKSMQIKLGDFPISESVRVIVFSEVSILLFEVKDDFTEACGAWLSPSTEEYLLLFYARRYFSRTSLLPLPD